MASEEDALEQAKAILGEHFQHYAVVVQYDDGSVWHEGNNELVSKALHEEALNMIREEREWPTAMWTSIGMTTMTMTTGKSPKWRNKKNFSPFRG